jgi:hypothetical protein
MSYTDEEQGAGADRTSDCGHFSYLATVILALVKGYRSILVLGTGGTPFSRVLEEDMALTTSGVTSKPAIEDHFKTGQRKHHPGRTLSSLSATRLASRI